MAPKALYNLVPYYSLTSPLITLLTPVTLAYPEVS